MAQVISAAAMSNAIRNRDNIQWVDSSEQSSQMNMAGYEEVPTYLQRYLTSSIRFVYVCVQGKQQPAILQGVALATAKAIAKRML
eukprot:4067017-Amphidinium_carterae.1